MFGLVVARVISEGAVKAEMRSPPCPSVHPTVSTLATAHTSRYVPLSSNLDQREPSTSLSLPCLSGVVMWTG